MSSSGNASVTPSVPANVADPGKIRTGFGFKILPPTKPPVAVADAGKIRTGFGFKIFAKPVSA